MTIQKELGDKGERLAVAYLIEQGYIILETNWRYKRAEIDVIAMDVDVLVCIEDALAVPIQGQFINFAFNLTTGTGRVDGVVNSGLTANATGGDGCVVALVETTGIPAGGGGDMDVLTFSSVDTSAGRLWASIRISRRMRTPASTG